MVLTPGGRRPKENVQSVAPHEIVDLSQLKGVGVQRRQLSLESIKAASTTRVLTPGGFRHPSLVHPVESGHRIQLADAKINVLDQHAKKVAEIDKGAVANQEIPGLGTGWIAYCYWVNTTGNPVTSFRTTWIVPPAPSQQESQTIFLFNGIDPQNPSQGILQPVLQWGTSAAGGGSYWSAASWYVTGDGHAFHTPLVPVNEGDVLVGAMRLVGGANGLFTYACEFEGLANSTLTIDNLPELVWLNQTLEAYEINQCGDYPNTIFTAFRNIEIETGKGAPIVSWTPVNQVTDCGQHATVINNSSTGGEVNIYYTNRTVKIPVEQIAAGMKILIGVTNDGSGIAILSNGQIIHIQSGGPGDPVLSQIMTAVGEIAAGIATQQLSNTIAESKLRETVKSAGREVIVGALERTLKTLKNVI